MLIETCFSTRKRSDPTKYMKDYGVGKTGDGDVLGIY